MERERERDREREMYISRLSLPILARAQCGAAWACAVQGAAAWCDIKGMFRSP